MVYNPAVVNSACLDEAATAEGEEQGVTLPQSLVD